MKQQQETKLEIETLEERIVPGTLTVSPTGFTNPIGQLETQIPSTSPKFGLTMAHDSTGGVITWTPGT